MKAPPKRRIRYYLLELTQALLEHLEYFEGNKTDEPYFTSPAKYTIESACREILQQTEIREYKYDKGSQKYIDVTYFSKSERQKFEQAQNKIIELEKWVSDLRDKLQQANRQAAKDRHNLTQLEKLMLDKVSLAIGRFERANPAVSIEGSLKDLILEETKDVQELLR